MSILKETYNRVHFLQFLSDRFLPEDFREGVREIEMSRNQFFATKVYRLGECKSLELEVYEIHHTSLHDARVGIAKDAFQMLLHHSYCNRALVAFVPTQGEQWRFSLLQMDAELSPTNRIQRSYSNPRRYSFLLGEGAQVKTPTQFLIDKGRVRQRTEGNKTLTPLQDLQHRFSIEALTQDFYGKLYNWYLWAVDKRSDVYYPEHLDPAQDKVENKQIKIIRLITRMLFVWFIKQKHLVPDNLFDVDFLNSVLKDFEPTSKENGNYYNAILQNLFFATLNQEIEGRTLFTTAKGLSSYYGNKQLYRDTDKSYFTFPMEERKQRIVELFKDIPYLNGGLFECLDQYEVEEQEDGSEKLKQITNFDGFSHRPSKRANIPNAFFFAEEHAETVTTKDATETTPAETQTVSVMGLINLFKQYNFTVEENTTSDKEVSLDPELLGRVFENLLAAYNPETQESARKSTGSFYTPREIVEYMVEEALIAYLSGECANDGSLMRQLVKGDEAPIIDNPQKVIGDLKKIKILDPACGSGAFPMGILLKITDIIEKLTPEGNFNRYETKLEIIKNCIYGIDIQAIAMLICKLRFFISLICDCDKDAAKDNFGIVPLPNLETKFVAANSLLPAKVRQYDEDWTLDEHLKQLQQELLDLRVDIFDKRTHKAKLNNKIADRKKCKEIADYIKQNAVQPDEKKIAQLQDTIARYEAEMPKYATDYWVDETVAQQSLFDTGECTFFRRNPNKEKREKLQSLIRGCKAEIQKEQNKGIIPGFEQAVEEVTQWNPYNQNSVSPFFDAEWMFGVGFNRPSKEGGFDVVIGNPPYISHDSISENIPCREYDCFEPFADIFCYFFEFGINSLSSNGTLSFITSNSYLRANYGFPLRKLIHKKCTLLKIVDIEGTQVFDSAIVNTAITLFTKAKIDVSAMVVSSEWNQGSIESFVLSCGYEYNQQDFDMQPWTLIRSENLHIRNKIEKAGPSLMELNTKIRLGLATGDNNAFVLNEQKYQYLLSLDPHNEEIIKPVIRGQDIKRYFHSAPQYLLLTKNGVDVKNDYPTIYNYLDSFGERFKHRGAQGRHWTNLRACAFFDDFKEDKIIWIELTDMGRFSLSCKEEYLLNSAYFLIPPTGIDTKYLLGLLNSSVVRFYIKQIAATSGMGTLRWINNYVKLVPIPTATPLQQNNIIADVNIILEKKSRNPQIDISEEEAEIDNWVYEIFNLNESEIALIEQG